MSRPHPRPLLQQRQEHLGPQSRPQPRRPQGGSGEQYFLGDFDGKAFHQSRLPGSHGWTNYGKDDYCAISFNDLPKTEKPILLGWMSNWQYAAKIPTTPWRGQMSLPRRLSYLSDAAGLALKQEPVVAPLRGKTTRSPPSPPTPPPSTAAATSSSLPSRSSYTSAIPSNPSSASRSSPTSSTGSK
ncbi:hypothetical protein [Tunturiibacter gelidiferens]|uniref:hypothetical protein n=1 Tax=Tunturiibacter gelidiferens TaxID=3069689 RepID=UPI003D9AF70C